MSKYVEFTQDEIDRAAHTDIKSFLEAKGEKVHPSGTEWLWDRHDSVKIRGHIWYQHSTGDKGTAIDFLCTFYDMRFPEAVLTLLGKSYGDMELRRTSVPKKQERKQFHLPPNNRYMQRMYAYLTQVRCLSSEVITAFVHKKILYESADHHNVVFVGRDNSGEARYAALKGTLTDNPYEGEVPGSDKAYGFNHTGTSSILYVFEAPIDLMSFIQLQNNPHWQQDSYIALGGLSDKALEHFLKDNPHINKIVLALDNDANAKEKDGSPAPNHGQAAALIFQDKYTGEGYDVSIYKPKLKDWNEIIKNKSIVHQENIDNN